VDLAHATDLARLAQDTAVIANLTSSEAFQQLTYVLQTGNVRMARTLGLNVQFGKAQQDLAKELGKVTAELSEQEIMQARTNAVMKAGERIAGTYDAAMGSVGKKILSMARPTEELSRLFGEALLPVLDPVVTGLYNMLSGLVKVRQAMEEHRDEMTYGVHTYEEYLAEMERLGGQAGRWAGEVIYLSEAQWELRRAVAMGAETSDQWTAAARSAAAAVEDLGAGVKEYTENQYYAMAADAMAAGDTQLAMHYWTQATAIGAVNAQLAAYIAAMKAAGSMQMAPGGSSMWAEIARADLPDIERQHGGPVKAGKPYIVGEREAELFVPSQAGNIYNQNQLAGGDVNINNGLSQRAFNNMAEDFFRGLGG